MIETFEEWESSFINPSDLSTEEAYNAARDAGMTDIAERDSRLFFELISTASVDGKRKVKSYAEIAKRTGITRQAVQKRYKQVCRRFTSCGCMTAGSPTGSF